MSSLLHRIVVNPAVCHGSPCIRGTRIMVWLILEYLANGDGIDDILAAYPGLTRDDVRACLAYAALAARETVVDVEATEDHALQT
ncbi:MAG: DUF433 domain-containing protein [Thermodesulfobacteriota bacterium]